MKRIKNRVNFSNLEPNELKSWICQQNKWTQINLKKKRNRKKFEKEPWKYISKRIKLRFISYCLAYPVKRFLNYPGLASKIVQIEPWPEGLPILFDKD